MRGPKEKQRDMVPSPKNSEAPVEGNTNLKNGEAPAEENTVPKNSEVPADENKDPKPTLERDAVPEKRSAAPTLEPNLAPADAVDSTD